MDTQDVSKDQHDRKTSIRRLMQGGVKFIAWNELKLNTMVGRGHAAEVYSGIFIKECIRFSANEIVSRHMEEDTRCD